MTRVFPMGIPSASAHPEDLLPNHPLLAAQGEIDRHLIPLGAERESAEVVHPVNRPDPRKLHELLPLLPAGHVGMHMLEPHREATLVAGDRDDLVEDRFFFPVET